MTWRIYVRNRQVSIPDWFYNLFIRRRWIHNLRYWRKVRRWMICCCCEFIKVVQNEDNCNIGVCDNEHSKQHGNEMYPDDTCSSWKRPRLCPSKYCPRYEKCQNREVPILIRTWVILSQWLSGAHSR